MPKYVSEDKHNEDVEDIRFTLSTMGKVLDDVLTTLVDNTRAIQNVHTQQVDLHNSMVDIVNTIVRIDNRQNSDTQALIGTLNEMQTSLNKIDETMLRLTGRTERQK